MDLRSTFEEIDAVAGSKFGEELTSLFVSFDIEVEKFFSSFSSDVDYQYIYKKALKHFKPKMDKAFTECIEKNTGFPIRVNLVKVDFFAIIGTCIAIDHGFEDKEEYYELLSAALGFKGDDFEDQLTDKTLNQIEKFNSLFDPKKGTLDLSKFPKEMRKAFESTLFFSFNDFFGFKYQFGDRVKENALNARERAAVFMHEVGHVVSLAECIGDTVFVDDYIRHQVNHVKTKDIRTVASDVETLTDFVEDKYPFLKKNKTFKSCTSFVHELNAKEGTFFPMILKGAFFFSLFIVLVIDLLLNIYTFLIELAILFPMLSILMGLLDSDRTYTSKKRGDQATTRHNIESIEFRADNYVSLQGYGRDLVSSLKKFDLIFNYYHNMASFYPKFIRNSSMVKFFYSFEAFLGRKKSNIMAYLIWETHGRDLDRFQNALNAQIRGLRKFPMDSEEAKYFMENIESTIKNLKKAKGTFSNNDWMAEFFYAISSITSYLTGGILMETFVEKGNRKRLEQFTTTIDRIYNSKQLYQSYKLSSLANRY